MPPLTGNIPRVYAWDVAGTLGHRWIIPPIFGMR
jgi:hypothetical protein